MNTIVPAGFQLTGLHCGIKSDRRREDLTLIVCPGGAVAAGVYTQNVVHAAPVAWDRQRTPGDGFRAVLINSGNANACTGRRGANDAQRMAQLAADALGASPDQVLIMSTGVIGHYLPMDKIAEGVRRAAGQLGADAASLLHAARGMMTTDRGHKVGGERVRIAGGEAQLTGLAKGAGMIGPHMATMLCVVMTDASLTPDHAQQALTEAVEESFNCMSVEGHMSTNDTVLLLASGAARPEPLDAAERTAFRDALTELCVGLARQIADDGEGASHLITIRVGGCASRSDARQIAKTIANSPLVKTGIAGADPNWGRVISAAGAAGVAFDPDRARLAINGFVLYQDGEPQEFNPGEVRRSIKGQRETQIELHLAEGNAEATFWTSDLTVDYVRLNTEYHT